MKHRKMHIPFVMFLLISLSMSFAGHEVVKAEITGDWVGWANVAWKYFQPGVAVNANTGLHYATAGWHRFTDWDLGVYVEVIVDAEKLGILARSGTWGADYRVDKILGFLETRQLSSDGLPFAQYDADTGNVPSDIGSAKANPSDSGKLLLSLDDLRDFRPDLLSRINSAVSRHNFQKMAQSMYFGYNDIYPAYAAQGYHAFGYSTPKLRSVESLGDGNYMSVYGESLPVARITCEPLLSAILEGRSSGLYRTYADRVFSAHQKRYEATGNLTAFSEGSYWGPYYYVYQWVVKSRDETWVVYASEKINAVPLVYTKIAFAFHAIYHNEYTLLLVNQLSPLKSADPLGGFYEGKSEAGATLDALSDKTNGMILSAARYYVEHQSQPTFELRIQPSSLKVVRGEAGSLNVQITPVGGFAQQVTLAVTETPEGVSYELDQSQATPPATVNLHVGVSEQASLGMYEIIVSGISGSISKQYSATLTVRARTSTNIRLSMETANVSEKVAITGATQPARVDDITILVSFDGSAWTTVANVRSLENGSYLAEFSPSQNGTYTIKARAEESTYFLSSESDPVALTAIPEFAHAAIMLAACTMLICLLKARSRKRSQMGNSS